MRQIFACLILLVCFSCKNETKAENIKVQELKLGAYRAVLELQDHEILPFNFEVTSATKLKVFNAEEVIDVDEITYRNDSVFIKLPVFEGYIAAKFKDNNLIGNFIKASLDRVVPFSAEFDNAARFNVSAEPSQNISGIWETVFSKDIAEDEYIAKGIFKHIFPYAGNRSGDERPILFRGRAGEIPVILS